MPAWNGEPQDERHALEMIDALIACCAAASAETDTQPPPTPHRKRRRQANRKIVPLTAEQTEAMSLVGEHKGDVTAAAKAAGKSRQAMKKLYDKANRKLGKKAMPKPKTQPLPMDQRGQANVADRKASVHSERD